MQLDEYTFKRMEFALHKEDEITKINCGDQYNYWKKRINERIEYLTPLMNELKEKGYNLALISKELHQEWILLIESKEYFNF